MSRTEKTLKNIIFGLGSKILNVLIAFGTRTVFIYALGKEYLGVSSLFTSILTVLSLAELGFAEAITYNLYKPLAEENKEKVTSIMHFFKKVYLIVGLTVFVLGMALIPWLDYLVTDVPEIKENITVIYILYVINSAISYLYVYKSTLLEAAQQKYLISTVNTIVTLIKSILNCVLLLITKNFLLYLVIEIVGTVLYNIIISRVTEKKYPNMLRDSDVTLSKEEKKGILKNVKAMFFYKASGVVLTSTDNIVINGFINTVTVGIYSNYTLITNQVYTIILQIFNAATASIGNLAVCENKDKQYEVFRKMQFFCFAIYCVCCAMLFVLLNPFIKIWIGDQYLLPISTIIVIIINFYLTGILTVIASFRTTNGLFVQGQYRPIIMAVINIIVSIVLVKLYGITGVVLGTIISRLCTQAWYDPCLIYKKVFSKNVGEYFWTNIKYIIVTITCCGLAYIMANYIVLSNAIINLIIKAVIAFLIPIIAIVLLYRKTFEFNYFLQLIKKYLKNKK